MKKIITLAAMMFLTGCAALDTVGEILTVFEDPEPVCDSESVGLKWKGDVCLKLSDGSYEWRTK